MLHQPTPPKRVSQHALRVAAGANPLVRPLLVALDYELERSRQRSSNMQGLCAVAAAKIRLGDFAGATATIDKISKMADWALSD
jgi:hypothetical protein